VKGVDAFDWKQPDHISREATQAIVAPATHAGTQMHPIVLLHSAKASHERSSRVSDFRGNTPWPHFRRSSTGTHTWVPVRRPHGPLDRGLTRVARGLDGRVRPVRWSDPEGAWHPDSGEIR
jgi:hypothetical protein